jgi:hypothetical protein
MRPPVRPLLAVAFPVFAALAPVLALGLPAGDGRRAADPPAFETDGEPDARQRERLAGVLRKEEVAAGLLHGEFTLDEAADRFRELTRPGSVAWDRLRGDYPTAGDDELYLRWVLRFAGARARRDGPEAMAFLRRVEEEVDRRYPPAPPPSLDGRPGWLGPG